jgi:hypothetical protein
MLSEVFIKLQMNPSCWQIIHASMMVAVVIVVVTVVVLSF